MNGIVCLTQLATMFFYPATVHFQSCTLNVNETDVVLCFRKLICAFSLTCCRVCVCKISDKSGTFSLNYSNLFRRPLFSGHSVYSPLLVDNENFNHCKQTAFHILKILKARLTSPLHCAINLEVFLHLFLLMGQANEFQRRILHRTVQTDANSQRRDVLAGWQHLDVSRLRFGRT